MERTETTTRPSGIPKSSGLPRPSRLPVLNKRPSQVFPPVTPQPLPEPAANSIGAAKLKVQKRTLVAPQSRPGNGAGTSVPTAPTIRKPAAREARPVLASSTTANSRGSAYRPPSRARIGSRPPAPRKPVTEHDENTDQLGSLDSFRSASRQGYYEEVEPAEYIEPVEEFATPKPKRASRPSLSDRTIESLQSVPATPKDRRRSSFFSPQSPMDAPPRPSSSLSRTGSGNSRPGTSDGNFVKPAMAMATPKAPASAKPASRTSLGGFGIPGGGRRSVSAAVSTRLQSTKGSMPPPPPRASSPTKPVVTSRSVAARPSKPRPALAGAFAPPKPETPQHPKEASGSAAAKGNSSSSAVLRQQIAAAKAAARKDRTKGMHDSPQKGAADLDNANDFDMHLDPFNNAPKDEKHILRNRINAARTSGKLNIAAMNLRSIPGEVLSMYDAAAMEDSKVNWAEVVDLTKLIVADNEIETLEDNVFPDVSAEELDADEQSQGNQFGGLELLDLHGNQLTSIPMGIRRLERLTTLNLSHNKLDNSVLDIVVQIKTLKELRLGNNNLSGHLAPGVCELPYLETLDLQSNRLLALPEALRELVSLKVLNVSGNQLTALPMEALQQLPLTDLFAGNNALIGSLFPLGCASEHLTLRTLSIANNSLAALTFSQQLGLPRITTLDVTNNHLTILPPIDSWSELITLTAGDNKIAELPVGFTDLKRLRNVNFSGNQLRMLPPEVANMETLESLILASNPLRDRKYLTMDAGNIKQDLRARLEPVEDEENSPVAAIGDTGEDGSPTAASPSRSWSLKANGLLDLSGQGLTDDINNSLGSFFQSHEVRQLNLSNNKLTCMPPSLWLARELRMLDLSGNPFTTEILSDNLELPILNELRLRNCSINIFDSLLDHLQAPALQTLDLTANRLQGPLPALRDQYPMLTTVFAADNKFTSISARTLKGLQVVNLDSNELAELPAEVGLLWDQGLRSLDVGRNAFRVPGYRILDKGTESVMRWLRDRLPAEDSWERDVD